MYDVDALDHLTTNGVGPAEVKRLVPDQQKEKRKVTKKLNLGLE